MSETLTIGRLRGGGLVPSWHCNAACRHCVYAGGPQHPRSECPQEAEGALLDDLAARAPGAGWHIGGGEPFADLGRLGRLVEGMRQRGMRLDYVETNAGWARDTAHAEPILAALAARGLQCVLVSLSPFHAEHVPLGQTLAVIEAARRSLPFAALVWMPHFLADLEGQPRDQRLDFERLAAACGEAWALDLSRRYGLVGGGRAGRFLHASGQRLPWQQCAARSPCRERLTDTGHFHVDLAGRYLPGLCAGLFLPWAEVPGDVDLGRRPVLASLWRGGVEALVDYAGAWGFEPAETYSGACDLCTQVRLWLCQTGRSTPELGPPGFYGGLTGD